MRILVTGGTGFIGGYVVQVALHRGHDVVVLSRSTPPPDWNRLTHLKAVRHDLSGDTLRLGALSVDAVIHLAASFRGTRSEQHRAAIGGTQALLEAMRPAGIKKLVGISSIAVLDYASIEPLSLINEQSSICRDEHAMGLYATLKVLQEVLFAEFAKEHGCQCITIRPGLVYDHKRLSSAHAGLLGRRMRLLADHDGEVPVAEALSVAHAIVNAAETDIPSGEIIHLVDDKLPSQREYLAALRQRKELPPGGVLVPWRVLHKLAGAARGLSSIVCASRKLPQVLLAHDFAARMKPFRFSNAKAKRLLSWAPKGFS